MVKIKRLVVSTIMGVVCGFICFGLASSGPNPVLFPIALMIILSRTLIGFVIGISSFKMIHWSIHGVVMGLIVSVPLSFGSLLGPDNPQFTKTAMLAWTIILGMIYGLLIEIVTSVVFKLKQE